MRCFHPLKSGRNPQATARCAPCRLCFHPLKSGRNWARVERSRLKTVSIPSSRVGTQRAKAAIEAKVRFPSPQVGSEPPSLRQGFSCRCFHPLKSGRNAMAEQLPEELEQVSIPSSRVGTFIERRMIGKKETVSIPSSRVGTSCHRVPHKSAISVSIPSSRVGTASSRKSPNSSKCFHPLKSGRNKADLPFLPARFEVSIPSSRVGTRCLLRGRKWVQAVSIPSSRVGTSGRNHENRSSGNVSIPSSRVGTYPYQLAALVFFKFPSPQVGSERSCYRGR